MRKLTGINIAQPIGLSFAPNLDRAGLILGLISGNKKGQSSPGGDLSSMRVKFKRHFKGSSLT